MSLSPWGALLRSPLKENGGDQEPKVGPQTFQKPLIQEIYLKL